MPRSFHSWEDSSIIRLHQCLILGKFGEYSHATRTFQPMKPTIFSKDTVVALHQLHPPLFDLVPSPIFYYKLEHTFVLDRILFAQALATAPHFFQMGFLRWYMNIS